MTDSGRVIRCPISGYTCLARVAAGAVLAAAVAACGGSGSPGGQTRSAKTAHAARTPLSPVSASVGSARAAVAAFVPITEPFDPGHPARPRPAPVSCGGQASTPAIEGCLQAKTESTDAAIDAVQLGRFQHGSAAERAAILASDHSWLAWRQPVCAKAFNGTGMAGQIDVATCLLSESTARLAAVRGVTPAEEMLRSTDSIDPGDWSWYTTPEGSRISMLDTQGDNSGGVIISWVIIGGAAGFVVNPAQFYFQDGTFTDHGVTEPPDPSGHRVLPGAEYQFSIDYRHLSADPGAAAGRGGYVYSPVTPVATWR